MSSRASHRRSRRTQPRGRYCRPLRIELLEDRRLLAAGDLDPTFGLHGLVTTSFGGSHDYGRGVAIQTDGKTVVAGESYGPGDYDFAVARYNPDGSLDTAFSGDGKLTTDFGSPYDYAFGVAIQADGKIVVAGHSNGDFAVARYNADGSLDTSLDGDGKLTTDFGSTSDGAYSVAIQADGKIVVAGSSYNSGSKDDFAVARYNTDGSLDTLFDGDGKLTTGFVSFSEDRADCVAIQADGKIVVAGHSRNGASGPRDFAVARYNTNGSLDTSFDSDGKLTTNFGSSDYAYGVAIQADGKIVVAGMSGGDFAVARYEGIDIPVGDYDQNGTVDDGDWTFWKSHFGETSGLGLAADGNGDGTVDAADYTVWRDNWGRVSGPPEIAGDYDRSGVVDDGDYILWKSLFGRSGAGWAADGNGNGTVDAADYTVWRDNVGTGAGAGAVVGGAKPQADAGGREIVAPVVAATVGEGGAMKDKAPSPYPLSATADLRPKGEGFEPQAEAVLYDSARRGIAAIQAWHRDMALLRVVRQEGVSPHLAEPKWGQTPQIGTVPDDVGDDADVVDAALADMVGDDADSSLLLLGASI
jgi:uncharacterized delta-60 repeat protein